MQHGVCRPDEVNVYLGAAMRFTPAESGPDVNAPELHRKIVKKWKMHLQILLAGVILCSWQYHSYIAGQMASGLF